MGATYTRQSSYSDGDTITAAHTNDEFNQLLAAFAASTGHTHDGTTAEGGPITKLLGNTLTFGAGTAGTDITVTFDGETSDGVLKWMEDEDYFEFSDDILVASTEKLQFRDTAIYINSSTDGQLDLVADTEIQLAATTVDLNGNLDVSGSLTLGGVALTSTTAELNILDGVTATAAEINLLDGVSGLVQADFTKLAAVDSTATELNIVDGNTSIGTTAVSDGHGIVMNHGGTMAQTTVQTLAAYLDDEITAMPNLVTTAATTVGALNSGSITSGFGTIDTGSSAITTTGLITGGSLDIDDVVINGATIGHTDDTDLITLANGTVTIAGDLTVSGDDITMGTNTAGNLLVADGTNFNSIAVGDLSSISTVANDDVFLAVDTSGGGLKKITRSTIVSGLAIGGVDLSNVVEDTTPQLGGDLDAQGKDLEDIGVSSADSHVGIYGSSSAPVTLTVTVTSKTAAHPYYSDGSSSAYFINGVESPALTLHGVDNVTSDSGYYYKFDQADSSNSGHPLRFYLDADKTTAFTTGVTTSGTPGNAGAYTQIDVDEDTPSILYYQCSAHAYMGNHAVVLGSNKINHSEALISFPTATTTLVGTGTTDTLTNKTLTSPKINEDVAVTATATELNTLDGITAVVGELNALDIGSTAIGTAVASKAVILDANKDYTGIRNLTLAGNLTVNGTTTTIDTTNTTVKDSLLGLNSGASSNSNDVGIIIERGSTGNDALFMWDESADKFALGTTTDNASSTGNLNMTTGTLVANIEGNVTGDLTGTASTATVATTVTISDNESTNEDNAIIFTSGGDVDGGNIGLESDGDLTYNPSTGRLTATQLSGTLQTAAQANVTSLGTLTTLTVDNVIVNGATIGHTDDTDLITLADGVATVAGEVSMTTLDIGGTNVTSTAGELNLLDGSAKSTSSITVADSDAILIIDGTTTKQIPASDIKTYASGDSATKGFATAMAIAL